MICKLVLFSCQTHSADKQHDDDKITLKLDDYYDYVGALIQDGKRITAYAGLI